MLTASTTPTQWFNGPDTGPSSLTIYCEITGEKARHPDIPLDDEEFGRCHRLLLLFPRWRSELAKLAIKYPGWIPFVRDWDSLATLHTTGDAAGLQDALRTLGAEARDHMSQVARQLVAQGHIAEQPFEDG